MSGAYHVHCSRRAKDPATFGWNRQWNTSQKAGASLIEACRMSSTIKVEGRQPAVCRKTGRGEDRDTA